MHSLWIWLLSVVCMSMHVRGKAQRVTVKVCECGPSVSSPTLHLPQSLRCCWRDTWVFLCQETASPSPQTYTLASSNHWPAVLWLSQKSQKQKEHLQKYFPCMFPPWGEAHPQLQQNRYIWSHCLHSLHLYEWPSVLAKAVLLACLMGAHENLAWSAASWPKKLNWKSTQGTFSERCCSLKPCGSSARLRRAGGGTERGGERCQKRHASMSACRSWRSTAGMTGWKGVDASVTTTVMKNPLPGLTTRYILYLLYTFTAYSATAKGESFFPVELSSSSASTCKGWLY